MTAKKILFIAQEISPYVPESPLTPLGRELPLSALEAGREVRTFMPKWGNINERRGQLHEVIRLSGLNVTIDETEHPLIIKVASVVGTRMQVYFIDNEDFFNKRLAVADKEGNEYSDQCERRIFYARSVIETIKKLRWVPEVIYCQGWISALVPLFLRTVYSRDPMLKGVRTVFTPCTDMPLTLKTGDNFRQLIQAPGMPQTAFRDALPTPSPLHFDKLGIKHADAIALLPSERNEELRAYATKQNKPILELPEGPINNADVLAFIDGVWSKGKVVE